MAGLSRRAKRSAEDLLLDEADERFRVANMDFSIKGGVTNAQARMLIFQPWNAVQMKALGGGPKRTLTRWSTAA